MHGNALAVQSVFEEPRIEDLVAARASPECERRIERAIWSVAQAELTPIFEAGRHEWLEITLGREIPSHFGRNLQFPARFANSAVAREEIAELGRFRELAAGAQLNSRVFEFGNLEADGAISVGEADFSIVRAVGSGDDRLDEGSGLSVGNNRSHKNDEDEEKYAFHKLLWVICLRRR